MLRRHTPYPLGHRYSRMLSVSGNDQVHAKGPFEEGGKLSVLWVQAGVVVRSPHR